MKRLLDAVKNYFTGKTNEISEKLEADPGAAAAGYDSVKSDAQKGARELEDAISGIEAERVAVKDETAKITGEIDKLLEMQSGIQALAKQRVAKIGVDQAGTDEEVLEHKKMYVEATEKLAEKTARLTVLKNHADMLARKVDDNMIPLNALRAKIAGIEEKKADAVIDLTVAQQQVAANNAAAGIDSSAIDARLEQLAQTQRKANAQVEISGRLAGLDKAVIEDKYLTAAKQGEADNAFFTAIGVTPKADVAAAPAESK